MSPFFLPAGELYDGWFAKNVENAWQYSKVYERHDDSGKPSDGYWIWASKGWNSNKADRYPMGKGVIPKYSWWDGESLSYIEARKKIYVPLYSRAVVKTEAYSKLVEMNASGIDFCLWDFDGYDTDADMEFILNDPKNKMGHAFVIKWLLEGKLK